LKRPRNEAQDVTDFTLLSSEYRRVMMMEKKLKALLLSQLEEALEERQNTDRRKNKESPLPQGISQERRRCDRRSS